MRLTDGQRQAFADHGYLVLRQFFDVEQQIEPIRRQIHEVIGLVARHHDVPLDRGPYTPESFDAGYLQLKATDRTLAAAVYDGVKQLAPFVRLAASRRNEHVFKELRATEVAGVAGGGSGIRIDNPDEDQYRAWWHQEYPAQGRSLDGVVFWSPLRALTPELGPVEILEGSHREGPLQVTSVEDDPTRTGAYALKLVEEDEVVGRYPAVAPLTEPGDLVLIDFLTVHRSGRNTADRPRWTMQLRYFNFCEPTGASQGWAGAPAVSTSSSPTRTGVAG